MKGFYFVNSNIANRRAHTFQILNTAEFIDPFLSLSLVFPKYRRDHDLKKLFDEYGLEGRVPIVFQGVFGIKRSCLAAFLVFNISASYFLLKQKLQRQVDFIYLRSSFFFFLAGVARLLRVPFFYETHRKPLSWSERIRDAFLVKRAAGLVVVSAGLRDHYSKYNKNILIAHDAVSLQRFGAELDKKEARKKLGVSLDAVLGVYCGSVRKIKGVDVVFAAAKQLPLIKFEIVGSVASEFDHQASSPNVYLVGEKPQADIPLYLKAADFLILPHPDSEYSQSPMKLFEYLAVGRPILSTSLANVKEVLPPEGNLFFEPENSEDFVAAIKKYIKEKEVHDIKARQNMQVAKEYTWEKRGEKIARFIRQTQITQKT